MASRDTHGMLAYLHTFVHEKKDEANPGNMKRFKSIFVYKTTTAAATMTATTA